MSMLRTMTVERLKRATAEMYPNVSEEARVNHVLDQLENQGIIGLSKEAAKRMERYRMARDDTVETLINHIIDENLEFEKSLLQPQVHSATVRPEVKTATRKGIADPRLVDDNDKS